MICFVVMSIERLCYSTVVNLTSNSPAQSHRGIMQVEYTGNAAYGFLTSRRFLLHRNFASGKTLYSYGDIVFDKLTN